MTISSISSTPLQAPRTAPPAPKANDHDADDGVATAPPTPAPATPGTGLAVDKTA